MREKGGQERDSREEGERAGKDSREEGERAERDSREEEEEQALPQKESHFWSTTLANHLISFGFCCHSSPEPAKPLRCSNKS